MKNYQKRWAIRIFMAIGIFSIALPLSLFTPTANAADVSGTQNNAMLLLVEKCQGIKELDKDVGINVNVGTHSGVSGGDESNCKGYQKALERDLGCENTDNFFKKSRINVPDNDSSVGDDIYYLNIANFKDCVSRASAQYDRLASQMCDNPQEEESSNWDKCDKNREHLYHTLGCSKDMYQNKTSAGSRKIKTKALEDCKGRIDQIKAQHLKYIDSNGQVQTMNAAIGDAGFDEEAGTVQPDTGAGGGGSGETGTNCNGGAMGWLFCPMIDYMTNTLQLCARLIDNLMQVRFLAQTGDSIKIESAWRAFLSLANILLIIAFMVIVFSQSTGAGLNNYGIKRMLPRLVIAAILMNISFYICALAIDVSNIFGSSIMGLFIGKGSVSDAIISATGGPDGNGIIGGVLGGALLIGFLFLVMTPVVLSIILVFVLLIARQLVLLFLVLISPLAFVTWLLPNTEKYFKKWYELFSQMLILYPMAMAVFGVSLYFANFLGGPDGGGQAIDLGVENDTLRPILTQIIQLIVLCIPLIMLPMMLKNSSSIMGKIGGAADKSMRAMKFDKGLDAFRGGALSRAKTRAAFTGGNLYQRGLGSDRVGTGALNWAQERRRSSQAKRQARQKIIESRKAESEHDVNKRTLGELGERGSYEHLASEKLRQTVLAEEVKANKAVIENMQVQWKQEGLSADAIASKLSAAITAGDDPHTIEAAMGSLAKMGAGAQNNIAETIATAGPISSDTSRAAIDRARNDPGNFDSLVTGAGGVAKGEFDGNGEFQLDYLGLNTEQTMKQTAQSAQNFSHQAAHDLGSADAGTIAKARAAVENAERIVSDSRLAARVDSAALAHLQHTASLKTW